MTVDSTKLAGVNLTFNTGVIPSHSLVVLARLVTAFDLRLPYFNRAAMHLLYLYLLTLIFISSYLHAKHDSGKITLMLISNPVGDFSL